MLPRFQMNFLARLFRKPVTTKVTQPRFVATGLEVTEAQWRATPSLVSAAHGIVTSLQWTQILECLRTESPANEFLDLGVPLADRAIAQARTEGWNQCLATIKRLSTPIEPEVPMPEPDFSPKNETEEE